MILLKLHPPARLQITPNLIYQQFPIFHPDSNGARVDVIEFVVENPRRGEVVDEELDVRRHDAGLDRREVGTYHAGLGVRFGELGRPGACAAAYVQDVAEAVAAG